uniref:Beta-hexosaminidase n=1 Tax=Pyrodinium bahamense TaxID=73915 RepID=A0A7S0FD30_9DINO|mmetsp:Transcript_22035/g.60994  ORF Transcript_22035/g.60994 Transcript_22035/m.60994 type:complete len:581 (+) Transcript_22035:97-1839(+)|eukprot:CAMPEP_0179019672 /NCGR_PEP_ID=MMETSP0796-20121207/4987_1 /TAXON_ID=73915 /ORGANISM="Pyrodinium bahamense, Strain pbaha01" /LENGTH=580 /DNA_ID=CAMNT_0020715463 /DNA_START=36 /DNA_END=1778 /DNA_ORIENTATION=-
MRGGVWFALAAVAPCACGASASMATAAKGSEDGQMCSAGQETWAVAMLQRKQSLLSGMALNQADAAGQSASLISVWPPPQSFAANGPRRPLHPDFALITPLRLQQGTVLAEGLARYFALIATSSMNRAASSDSLRGLNISIADASDQLLNLKTDYSYRLTVRPQEPMGSLVAKSVYGALYGLETFTQLLDAEGALAAANVSVDDFPRYAWRGLMIDSGRRFFPLPLVKNLIDTMAAVKLNVLHLHASDHCRFGVESKLYPELTASLVGQMGGFYTQADIKELIAYAKQRGIRVVPEFDIPGHARGLGPLKPAGLKFCSRSTDETQLYNDPEGLTLRILNGLLAEMSALFEDDVFNIGSDETETRGFCTGESTFPLARHMVDTVRRQYSKTPEGWEEILFTEQAATQDTIVNAWSSHDASAVTAKGRRVVESAAAHFYFTEAAPAGATGWSPCHYDIGTGVPQSQQALLLGGQISMWSDTYCYECQCRAFSCPKPVAAALFPPEADEAFMRSIGGMIWPRGFVAAASFWNYDPLADPTSPEFVGRVHQLNDRLAARGSVVCPTGCACDQLSACGRPYQNEH